MYVGWHPKCGMPDIESACQAIWAGAKLYVASDVPFFATKQGRTFGYSYAIVGAIRRMTKAPMILTGKPSLHALRFVARKLGVAMRHVASASRGVTPFHIPQTFSQLSQPSPLKKAYCRALVLSRSQRP